MPIYDCRLNNPLSRRDGIAPGALPFPRFGVLAGRLVDATGQQIARVLWCDTDTGEVEHYELKSGRYVIDPATGRAVATRRFYPAPLAYLPPEPGTPVRYPPGQTDTGDGKVRDNEELAKEIADYAATNDKWVLENTKQPESENHEWVVEPPPEKGLIEGACIPPEVTQGTDTGGHRWELKPPPNEGAYKDGRYFVRGQWRRPVLEPVFDQSGTIADYRFMGFDPPPDDDPDADDGDTPVVVGGDKP